MSEAHARAWWADVEHLREAAERRSAERAKARIEGRDPVALTPLQPLHAVEGLAAFDVALDAVQPAAPGEVPRHRRFARDGAVAQARPEPPRTGTLTLVRDEDDVDAPARRFQRRPAPEPAEPPRPRLRGSGRPPAAVPANAADPSRRTVEIRGTVVPLPVALVPDQANDTGPARRRPRRSPAERFAASPDRVAAYAVLLGVVLIVVALLSAHGG
jgi:hypothetical protein